MTLVEEILVKQLGRLDYLPTFEAMRAFTARRNEATADEIWLLEHPPVYTLGQGAERPSVDNGIPLVQADRGGEITYHGPGQVVLYALVDLARRGIKVKQFVAMLESSVIELLAGRGERAHRLERRQVVDPPELLDQNFLDQRHSTITTEG